MMRVCITGGAGMIGSRLVREFCALGYDVIVIDNLWRGRLSYLAGVEGFDLDGDFHNLDLSDPRCAPRLHELVAGSDAVIHLADIVAGIDYVFSHQYQVFRINNLINTHVFRACAEAATEKILYAGTACSFPRNLQLRLDSVLVEDQLFPAEPESAYGWSKLMGTLELQFMAPERGASTSTLILHNVYGPRCDLDPSRSQVIPSLLRRMIELEDGGTLTVWGSGRQGRAFLHVDDVAAAFTAALQADELPALIQIGPSHCTSIKELVEILRNRVVRKPLEIQFDTTKPEGDIGRCADYSLAREVLGWSPRVDLEDGLRDTYRWIRAELNGSR